DLRDFVLVEGVEVAYFEAGSTDEVGDPAGEVTPPGDPLLNRFEPVLPALHVLVRGESVLDEMQGASGLQHPAHLAQRCVGIRDGAQRPGGQRRIETAVLERK